VSGDFTDTLPYALQQSVYEVLNAVELLTGRVHFFAAPIDTPLPYLEYWTGDGTPDESGGFGEEAQEYSIYTQVSSRDGLEGSRLFGAADSTLKYQRLAVPGWAQRGKVTWVHELDDPADTTQDDDVIYYAGGCYRIALFRQRTDI
jgi:hypothetical protein